MVKRDYCSDTELIQLFVSLFMLIVDTINWLVRKKKKKKKLCSQANNLRFLLPQ